MNHVLVAFEGEDIRKHMADLLEAAGVHVLASCSSGAEVLRWSGRISGGVVLTGYKLRDMTAQTLYECLPSRISVLLLATQMQLEHVECEEICKLCAPASKGAVVDSVQMLLQSRGGVRPPSRSREEEHLIKQAKALLMERNQMTEEQAHRFLQKTSMNAGAKLAETALKVLDGQLLL